MSVSLTILTSSTALGNDFSWSLTLLANVSNSYRWLSGTDERFQVDQSLNSVPGVCERNGRYKVRYMYVDDWNDERRVGKDIRGIMSDCST